MKINTNKQTDEKDLCQQNMIYDKYYRGVIEQVNCNDTYDIILENGVYVSGATTDKITAISDLINAAHILLRKAGVM
jgi:hypothetical protein